MIMAYQMLNALIERVKDIVVNVTTDFPNLIGQVREMKSQTGFNLEDCKEIINAYQDKNTIINYSYFEELIRKAINKKYVSVDYLENLNTENINVSNNEELAKYNEYYILFKTSSGNEYYEVETEKDAKCLYNFLLKRDEFWEVKLIDVECEKDEIEKEEKTE
jgi:DNA-binding transcriptional MerR regulator